MDIKFWRYSNRGIKREEAGSPGLVVFTGVWSFLTYFFLWLSISIFLSFFFIFLRHLSILLRILHFFRNCLCLDLAFCTLWPQEANLKLLGYHNREALADASTLLCSMTASPHAVGNQPQSFISTPTLGIFCVCLKQEIVLCLLLKYLAVQQGLLKDLCLYMLNIPQKLLSNMDIWAPCWAPCVLSFFISHQYTNNHTETLAFSVCLSKLALITILILIYVLLCGVISLLFWPSCFLSMSSWWLCISSSQSCLLCLEVLSVPAAKLLAIWLFITTITAIPIHTVYQYPRTDNGLQNLSHNLSHEIILRWPHKLIQN